MAPVTGPVRAVWTDYGGVLTPPVAETLEPFCARLGVPSATLLAAMRQVARDCGAGDDGMAPLDTPLLTQETWERRMEETLAAHSGIHVDLSDYPARWFADRAVNQPWLDTLHRLRRQGVFVGLLSNMPPAWDRHWRLTVPPEGLFDAVVLSYESGCRKPEREIFRRAAERAGVPGEQCVLVDDLAVNCAGAEQAGWHAVHFTDTTNAVARVEELVKEGRAGVGTASVGMAGAGTAGAVGVGKEDAGMAGAGTAGAGGTTGVGAANGGPAGASTARATGVGPAVVGAAGVGAEGVDRDAFARGGRA